MFFSLIIFIASIIIEAIILFMFSPDNSDGSINHIFIILFSINTGILFGAFYALMLIFVYWFLKAYDDIRERSFIRRSILFGGFVFLCVLLKLYSILDIYIFIGTLISFISLEFILSKREGS